MFEKPQEERAQHEETARPSFKVQAPIRTQVSQAVKNVINGKKTSPIGTGISSLGEQIRDFGRRNIITPELQEQVSETAQGAYALPESRTVENEQTGERLAFDFHYPTDEDQEEQAQREETLREIFSQADAGTTRPQVLLGTVLVNGERDGNNNVVLDGVTYPIEEVQLYADEYVKERDHNRKFAEDSQYRNEWFLKHVGVSADAYRNKVADELDKKIDALEKNIPHVPIQSTVYRGGTVAYDKDATANRMVKDARKIVNTLRKNNFWSGAAEGTNLENLLTFGLTDIGAKVSLLDALNKAEKGDRLTSTEQFYIDAWQLQQEAEQNIDILGGRNKGASIGRGAVQSTEFIGQMIASGGVAGAATKGISGAAARTMLKNAAKKGVEGKIMAGLKAGALKLSESVVGAAARTPFQAFTYDTYAEKRLAQFEADKQQDDTGEIRSMIRKTPRSAWKDALEAGLESFAETHSEDMGMWLNAGLNNIGKRMAMSRFGRFVGLNSLKGIKRNAALAWIGREGKIAGFASETLGEAYGDALVNLFENDRNGWRQMMTKDYWWELGGVTLTLTGSFGAMNLPAGISQARRNASLEQLKKEALAGIENKDLKSKLVEVGSLNSIADRSKALSKIVWTDPSVSKMDAARAVDYINAQTELDIRQGERSETERLTRILPTLQHISGMEYKGSEGKGKSGEAIFAVTNEGREYFILSGDLEKGLLQCLTTSGEPTEIAASEIVKKERINLSDLVSAEYVDMFGTQENQQYLDKLQTRVDEAVDAGVDDRTINDILREAGLTVYDVGEEVTTVGGREGIVSRVSAGRYEVLDNETGNVEVYGFNDILQPDPEIAEAQKTYSLSVNTPAAEQNVETRPEVEETMTTMRKEVDAIKNLDDDVVYEVMMNDGNTAYIIRGANIVYNSETGEMDYEASDATVVIKYADGTKKLVSTREIDSIADSVSAQEMLDAARQAAETNVAEADRTASVDEQSSVRLTDGSEGVIESINEDGSYRFAMLDESGGMVTRDIRPEDIAEVISAEEQQTASDSMLGRSLTDEEAQQVVAQMQENAVPASQIELTPENWDAEFGADGIVATPIGDVKMGENQYLKLLKNGREQYFGMIKPTLINPDIVLEEYDPKDGSERDSKYLFIKTFRQTDGKRYMHFESVTVKKDNREVSISSHEIDPGPFMKKMHNDKVMHLNESFFSSEGRLTEPRNEGPDLVPTPNDLSADKGTTSAPENQISGAEIPRLKNGQPDFNAMSAEQLAPSLLERFGAERTANLARNNIAESEKRAASIEKQISAATDPNKLDALDRKLQEAASQRQKYTDVLDLLGVPVDAAESQAERTQRLKQENTPWITSLFPDGLPNVESLILADIASGKKIRWTDKEVNGSVVSRGLGNELGLADSTTEQRNRFGLLANDAPTPEEYAEELPERLTSMGIRFDEGTLRDQVIDAYSSINTRRDARRALEQLAADLRAEEAPITYEDAQQMRAYEEQQRALREAENNATFAETSKETTDGTAEERPQRDNDEPTIASGNDRRGMVGDGTRRVEGTGDRGDIRVFEEGLAASRDEHSEYSERDRQEAEGQRLIAVAKQTGKYIDPKELEKLGERYSQRTGESVVYIDKGHGKVYKVKNPYAKAAIKNGAPEDAIYEHLIHNRLFPETKYTFEGITDHLGDVRIVLSQDFIPVYRSVSNDQIAPALAEKGFIREDNYTFGNDLVSVTDVEGDNVLPGDDGKLYFIDPIIKLKRPAREVLDMLDARETEELQEPDDRGDEVPFSVVSTENSAPAEVTPERWNAIIDQLRRVVGSENVITDPSVVRAKYNEIASRDEDVRRRQVEDTNARFNEQLGQLTPENADSTILDLGTPSPEMLAVGMLDKTLRLYGNKLLKKAEKHGYDISQVRDLPRAMEHPIAIFKGRYNGSYAVLTELNINGKPALATIGVNKDLINDINPVTSIYGKSANNLVKWIDAEKLLYTDKERTLDVLGLSAPIADALNGQEFEQKSVTATKIVTNFENPKIRPENMRRSIFSMDELRKEKREIERQAKADGTYLKAPNGQPTNLTPKQWLNVRTQAFKEWFGDWENDPANASKVVDENGEPRAVFHGANRGRAESAGIVPVDRTFHVFNTENNPSWFSTKQNYAEIYARDGNLYAGFADRLMYPGYRLYNAFINVKNPVNVGNTGYAGKNIEDSIRYLSEQSGLSYDDLKPVFDEYGGNPSWIFYIVNSKPFKERIVRLGYDGIAARETFRDVQTYAVVTPEQVKDARRNNGKYDSQNPDIRYFRTPQGEVYGFTVDGTIYLDGSQMNAETPIHEYTELWSQIVARENPQLWSKGTELMKQTKIWNEVNADPNYKELPEDLRVSETLSRIIAADFAREAKSIIDDASLLDKLRAWLRKFWGDLKATFSKWSNNELEKLTPKEFAKLPLRDFVEGIDLSKYNRTISEGKTLAGIHEISGKKLVKALQQGGLANPSLAVIDLTRTASSGYGDITLIAPRRLIDTSTGENEGTFDRDAWTPVYPKVVYSETPESRRRLDEVMSIIPDESLRQQLRAEYYRYLDGETPRNPLAVPFVLSKNEKFTPATKRGRFANSTYDKIRLIVGENYDPTDAGAYEQLSTKQKQLLNIIQQDRTGNVTEEDIRTGEAIHHVVESIRRYRELIDNPTSAIFVKRRAKQYLEDAESMLKDFDANIINGYIQEVTADYNHPKPIDAYQTTGKALEEINALGQSEEFETWNERFAETLGAEEKFFAGYEEDGSAIYRPNTLSEVSKYMNEQGLVNSDDHGLSIGFNRFITNFAQKMSSTEEIRANKDRLTAGNEVLFDKNELSKEFLDLLMETVPQKFADEKGYSIITHEMVAENILERLLVNGENIQSIEKDLGLKISTKTLKRIRAFGKKLREIPVRYFETKFARPVMVEEFVGAVIPEDADDRIAEGLQRAGVPYRTYRTLEERDEIVRNFTRDLSDVRFMRQPETGIEDISSEKIATEDTRKTKNEKLIEQLRQAMRDQRNDVRTVAKLVSNRIRKSFGRELIDVMGKRNFDAVIKQLELSTIRQDAEEPLRRIAEIVLDLEIKHRADKVDKLLNLRVQGETPRGVSIAKNVDDQTRQFIETIRDNLTRPAKEVMEMLEEKGASIDEKMGAALLENYQAAEEYRHDISDIDKEISEIKERNTQLRRERIAANKVGHKQLFDTLKAQIAHNNETIAALEEERLKIKGWQLRNLKIVAGDLEDVAYRGREIHIDWLEQRQKHKDELLHTAFVDAGDGKRIPVLDRQPGVWEKGWQVTKNFLLSPADSFNYLLKMISVNAPSGEGALYDHFMRSEHGFVAARGNYYLGYNDFKTQLDAKAKEIFSKGYTEVLANSNEQTDAVITISDGKDQEQYSPTIGEALYIYMADKMDDGRVKLRKMGIGEQDIDALAQSLPDGYVRFADWIQNEFLPSRRKVYNETHLDVFGTQMAEIANYVPLKIQKSNVYQEVDGTKTDIADLPSAITGSIIRRKRNNATLNLHTNALDLMLEHGQQMERWNAFTRIIQDANTLLSSTAFRRMLDNRNPGLHKKLKTAVQIASDSYRSESNEANKTWIALSKAAAGSKIAFRVNTAIKQVLSYPAFYAYSTSPKFWGLLTKNLLPVMWGKNFRWCLDNVPSFNERWLGRMAGNEKLSQMTAPKLDQWIAKMGQWGMFSNALIDAITCANGAKAVYDYRRSDYMKKGFTEVEAERRAKIDAALAINETQQSSEGMFLSRLQVDRDFWSVSLSTFQNSNFAYLRKQLEAVHELCRDAERERKNRSEYYKAQGLSDAEAWDAAVRDVVRAKTGAVANLLTFGYLLNVLWGIGNNVWKYLFADDGTEDMGQDLLQSALISTIRNTAVGSMVESVAAGHDLNPSVLLADLVGFIGKVKRIIEQDEPKAWDQTAAYIALQAITANGLGIDINSFANMYEGVAAMIRDGFDWEDLMLVLNAPRSQAKLIAGKPKEGETLDNYQRRVAYIERKILANADKKQMDKWARNYQAYRQAEALDLPTLRDKLGRVTVPAMKELEDSYAAVLKDAGLQSSGYDRSDAKPLTEEQKEKFKSGLVKKVYQIYVLKNRLNAAVVFNEAYAEQLKERQRLMQEVIDEWKK